MTEITRRGFIVTAGGSLAAAWLAADVTKLLATGRYAAEAGKRNPPPAFEFLSADQAADLEAATAQILPSDETAGAREAHVVYFIDHGLATWASDERSKFEKGVGELRRRARTMYKAPSFAALGNEQQHAVIAALEKDKHPFFEELRVTAILGFLANPSYLGNHEKVGWKTIGFDDRFSWGPPFGWYDANAR